MIWYRLYRQNSTKKAKLVKCYYLIAPTEITLKIRVNVLLNSE